MSKESKKLGLSQMASGHSCLELTDSVDWEDFPQFANKLLKRVGGDLIGKAESVDTRIWEVRLKGSTLRLVYEDYPGGVAFESSSDEGDQILLQLKSDLERGG